MEVTYMWPLFVTQRLFLAYILLMWVWKDKQIYKHICTRFSKNNSSKPIVHPQLAGQIVRSLMSKLWQNRYTADQITKLGTVIPQHV